MDWKIELIPVPVTDVDRAKAFYEKIGFHADHDHQVREGLRFVQFTPPGSACSIALGEGITDKPPGSQEIQVVVADAEAARRQLVDAGVQASEVDVQPWGSFVYFNDPDGNRWSIQALASRPPRVTHRWPTSHPARYAAAPHTTPAVVRPVAAGRRGPPAGGPRWWPLAA